MTHEPDRFDEVLALIERHLSGELPFDAAVDALKEVLPALAEQQERLWRQFERRPGDPITLKKLSAEAWQNPNVGQGGRIVVPSGFFAPGRSHDDEERGRVLFEEAFRRTFGRSIDDDAV